MASIPSSDHRRFGFNFTELSTRTLLLGAVCICALLWSVIATTVGI